MHLCPPTYLHFSYGPQFMHYIQPRAAAKLLHALQAMINAKCDDGKRRRS